MVGDKAQYVTVHLMDRSVRGIAEASRARRYVREDMGWIPRCV